MWLKPPRAMSLQTCHLSDISLNLSYHSALSISVRCNYGSKTTLRTGLGWFAPQSKIPLRRNPNFSGSLLPPRFVKTGQGRVLRCSSSENNPNDVSESSHHIELPLLPLPLVLFPGATLPLQIFEFRYRIMMHTLLQSNLRFGVVYTDSSQGMARVGCVGEVVQNERLVDDRFYLICQGKERFRVENIVRTKPFMVAEVQWLQDAPSRNVYDKELLAGDVEMLIKHVVELSKKLHGKPPKEMKDLPSNLSPTPYSFIVGSAFVNTPREQQTLLELEDTFLRLKRERETLQGELNFLSAACAIEDVFRSPTVNEN